MTALSQDFNLIAGDDFAPLFTVKDGSGAPIDISGVTEIVWSARRDASSSPVLTKQKTAGGIVLVGGGTGGQFQVLLTSSDTQPLSGYYLHSAVITDSSGDVSTVTLGRMLAGPIPAWTYSGDPSLSNKDAVRYLIGDTVSSDQQVTDTEILFALSQRTNIYGAAALVCRSLASRLSREADVVDRELRTSYSTRARAYLRMASEFEMQSSVRSGALPYAGGISVSDKQRQVNDTDRVKPQFNIGMDENRYPVGPAGNETQQD